MAGVDHMVMWMSFDTLIKTCTITLDGYQISESLCCSLAWHVGFEMRSENRQGKKSDYNLIFFLCAGAGGGTSQGTRECVYVSSMSIGVCVHSSKNVDSSHYKY